jgi:hypothetical protein
VVILVLAFATQARHDVRFARGLIRRVDVTGTTPYHLAMWINDHMPGERVFVGGSHSFHFNVFTDTPQFHGGHDPMQPSTLTLIGGFVIASGMNTGSRDMEISGVWLKALGAHAFSVPGPISDPYYLPFTNPERFQGHFPVLWREGDTTLYGVPTRSNSLAHVVPAGTLVQHYPVNGLDIDEMSRYVGAIEDPALPGATFRWLNRRSADIETKLRSGDVISIQERYMPGWTAIVNGHQQKIEHDALGLMVLRPDCNDCRITIRYDGDAQFRAACLASLAVTLLCAFTLVKSLIRGSRSQRDLTRDLQPAR